MIKSNVVDVIQSHADNVIEPKRKRQRINNVILCPFALCILAFCPLVIVLFQLYPPSVF